MRTTPLTTYAEYRAENVRRAAACLALAAARKLSADSYEPDGVGPWSNDLRRFTRRAEETKALTAALDAAEPETRDVAVRLAEGWHGTPAELVEMAQAIAGATPEASEPVREPVPSAGPTPALSLAADLAGLAGVLADVDGCDVCTEPFSDLDELAAGGRCRQCAAELAAA